MPLMLYRESKKMRTMSIQRIARQNIETHRV